MVYYLKKVMLYQRWYSSVGYQRFQCMPGYLPGRTSLSRQVINLFVQLYYCAMQNNKQQFSLSVVKNLSSQLGEREQARPVTIRKAEVGVLLPLWCWHHIHSWTVRRSHSLGQKRCSHNHCRWLFWCWRIKRRIGKLSHIGWDVWSSSFTSNELACDGFLI